MCLCGSPYTRGFFSKDIIAVLGNKRIRGLGRYFLIFAGLSFSSLYSLRLAWCGLYSLNNRRSVGLVNFKADLFTCKKGLVKEKFNDQVKTGKPLQPSVKPYALSLGFLVGVRTTKNQER